MKNTRALLFLAPLFLAACAGSTPTNSVSLDESLHNPLFAQRYYEDLSALMVTLTVNKDPILKDAGKKAIIDATREQAVKQAQAAAAAQAKGWNGSIMSDKDMAVGSVTLLDNALYFSTDFVSSPGPALHVYLSNAIDPRQVHFPDPTAVDLGALKNPYGAQTYILPKEDATKTFHSVALWDNALGMIYAFAQLQQR